MQFLNLFFSCLNAPMPNEMLGLFGFAAVTSLILWLGGLVREI